MSSMIYSGRSAVARRRHDRQLAQAHPLTRCGSARERRVWTVNFGAADEGPVRVRELCRGGIDARCAAPTGAADTALEPYDDPALLALPSSSTEYRERYCDTE